MLVGMVLFSPVLFVRIMIMNTTINIPFWGAVARVTFPRLPAPQSGHLTGKNVFRVLITTCLIHSIMFTLLLLSNVAPALLDFALFKRARGLI